MRPPSPSALNLNPSEQQKLRISRITGYNETQMAARRIVVRNGKVLLGIDVLEERQFEPLKVPNVATPRIGLVTNQTGIDSRGKRTIDVLWQAPGFKLDAIFSPEHGVTGTADTTDIANSKDSLTSVPIYSVYGDTDAKRRPSMDVIRKLDVIVVDLQDVGARFYTYETTLGYFLEAAAKAKKPIVVLDRPDPITGSYVQGPISDAGQESFVNYYPLPVRHGMTMGELAKLFNEEKHIDADLTVIPMRGWLRGDWFDSTGATWISPSPNLRSLEEATLYPGVALIEGTGVSVGRGTDLALPAHRLALLHRQRARQISQRPQHSRGALRADQVHSNLRSVRSPRLLRREHHRHQSRGARRARARHRVGRGAAQALSAGLRPQQDEPAAGQQSDLRRDPGRRGSQSHRRRLARALDQFMDVRVKYLLY